MRKTLLSLTPLLLLFFFLSCQKERSFELAAPGTGTLLDASGDCSPKTVGGTYVAGKALTDSNFIDVGVYVAKKGSYTITAPSQNGFSFKGTGSFADTGLVMVRLKATGIPAAAGTNDFTIVYDSLSCNVSIEVLPAGSTGGGGTGSNTYFPLTQNSKWSYDDPAGSGDTSLTLVSGTATLNSKSYSRFVNTYSSGGKDTANYRMDAANGYFYQYMDLDALFGGAIVFAQPKAELNFLRETLTTNTTWNNDFTGTASGIPITIRFKFTCTNAAQTVTYNGNTFNNVYAITMVIQNGSPLAPGVFSDLASINFFYAKGVGLINTVVPDPATSTTDNYTIRTWTVL